MYEITDIVASFGECKIPLKAVLLITSQAISLYKSEYFPPTTQNYGTPLTGMVFLPRKFDAMFDCNRCIQDATSKEQRNRLRE